LVVRAGVFVGYLLFTFCKRQAKRAHWPALEDALGKSGQYLKDDGTSLDMWRWALQMARVPYRLCAANSSVSPMSCCVFQTIWCLITVAARVFVLGTMLTFKTWLMVVSAVIANACVSHRSRKACVCCREC
jgi:hypothetical protein